MEIAEERSSLLSEYAEFENRLQLENKRDFTIKQILEVNYMIRKQESTIEMNEKGADFALPFFL